MIIVRHSEKCTGKPDGAGRLTGKCKADNGRVRFVEPLLQESP